MGEELRMVVWMGRVKRGRVKRGKGGGGDAHRQWNLPHTLYRPTFSSNVNGCKSNQFLLSISEKKKKKK